MKRNVLSADQIDPVFSVWGIIPSGLGSSTLLFLSTLRL